MTTHSMNGHRHSTVQVQNEILLRLARNQAAQYARTCWQAQALPDKFTCLDSPDPRIQLQEALKQIDALLQRQKHLLETVFLLDQALHDTQSLLALEVTMRYTEMARLRLSDDCHVCMQQLR